MKNLLIVLCCLLISCKTTEHVNTTDFTTICNPMDLSYRFGMEEPSRREAADASIVWFKDRYYMFVSKSGGYWHSKNLADWTFIETTEIPVEEYAPTAIAIDDTLYFLGSSNDLSTLYKSVDPLAGTWQVAVAELDMPVWDPAFFLDDDKRLYLYWGCSDVNPLYGVELDYHNQFAFMGDPVALVYAQPERYGWEVPGDYNELINQAPWIEGAWVNKINGVYYFQYSAPGTEYKSYADGVYVSENPLGPFTYQSHNPFVYKPEGFAAGAGHGSTIEDQYGNFWHVGTITISMKQVFERRLGLHPVFFDEDGMMYSITRFGDYPLIIPNHKVYSHDELFPGWMLLSYNKPVEVSSSYEGHPSSKMTDEDIRTYWAAETGGNNEYAIIDLLELYDVYAIQINFAEHNTNIFGRQPELFHQYTVEYSLDGETWDMLIDKSENKSDNTHDYTQLPRKVNCRFLRINNIRVPDGQFALSGFRVFGKGFGDTPSEVNRLEVKRNVEDRRRVHLSWPASDGAIGYNINFGIDPNKMYHHYQVYDLTSLDIKSLAIDSDYWFTIESFNENGITESSLLVGPR
ncbi:family 43 glycosylhydrolase [Natronoflexus pectinivorans]|uniref:F5/8 type C domain-containing protein n=1 Tax=Natronoflexus pectinivorans TaxID=682526 RepID=A0A4R2GK48_9BACT|nr:family 43 glycosylhydrolase [Natronoflexus pectinivorans]TCO08845.1 F5/8 type C domain-containing protein [Natronoflexus pectinivorans]